MAIETISPNLNDLTVYMRERITDKRKNVKGTMMNIPSVLKLIIALPSQLCP